MNEIEKAKNRLHINKIKVQLEENELKILERLEDIKRIETSNLELKNNIKTLESKEG